MSRRLSTLASLPVIAAVLCASADAKTSSVTVNNDAQAVTSTLLDLQLGQHFQLADEDAKTYTVAALKKKKFAAAAAAPEPFASSTDTTNNISKTAARMRRGNRRRMRRGNPGNGDAPIPSAGSKKKAGNKKKGSPRRGGGPPFDPPGPPFDPPGPPQF